MGIIRFAIDNPVKVSVGVLLVVLAGLIALGAIPIQLTPNVDQPIITVETNWVGRSPEEVERSVIEEQEDKLKGVTNLKKMTATASQGRGMISLEFFVGTDMTRALQEVSDKLREVPDYPDDVDQPVITAVESSSENAMAWLMLISDDDNFDMQGFYDIADKRIKPVLERVEGVGEVNIYGGREHQVHVQIDPRRLAQRGVTFASLVSALQGENVNVSAGQITDGRLDVRVRTVGQYDALDQVRQTIVSYDDAGPIRVGDLGAVVLTLEKQRSFVRAKGRSSLAIQIIRQTGSNVMSAMAQLRERIAYLNKDVLPQIQSGVRIEQAYDETIYIDDAIDLVRNNLFVGGTLAVLVLLSFLRTLRPTLVVTLAIPISVVGTFVVMTLMGRNLNVISLAGLAFAVGMVVDNAIVVLENTDRHLGMGKKPGPAALDAAGEVWGAILASTLTTLVVFAPVIVMKEEVGQLFRDISLAIVSAVSLSLVVSVTVIPSAAAHWLRERHADPDHHSHRFRELFGLPALMARGVDRFVNGLHALSRPTTGGMSARFLIVAAFTVAAIGGAMLLMPPTTYLPNGNRNIVFGLMINPPGYSIAKRSQIGHDIETKLAPYWQATSAEQLKDLPPVMSLNFQTMQMEQVVNIPPIAQYFNVAFGDNAFMGAVSADKNNVKPLAGLLSGMMWQTPGSMGFAQQMSLFGRGIEGTNAIDVEVSGNDMAQLRQVTGAIQGVLMGAFGPMAVRSSPQNFDLPGPELQVKIDRVKAANMGVNVQLIGLSVQALVDGATVGDYRYLGDNIDLLLVRDPDVPITPETLGAVPVAVNLDGTDASRKVVPLSSIATIERSTSPQEIQRIEQRRAFTLTVNAQGQPLEQAMNTIDGIVAQMRDSGVISGDIEVNLAGTADKLTQVRNALLGDIHHGSWLQRITSLGTSRMFLALLVTYLLMAALFESFLYPMVIMFTVPLATVGGFIGLRIVHTYVPDQQLDTLTMLGFVILIGVVVNNAILLVHQSLNFMRGIEVNKPLGHREAIRESVRTRIRPIFMTTLTSVAGMLPLVV